MISMIIQFLSGFSFLCHPDNVQWFGYLSTDDRNITRNFNKLKKVQCLISICIVAVFVIKVAFLFVFVGINWNGGNSRTLNSNNIHKYTNTPAAAHYYYLGHTGIGDISDITEVVFPFAAAEQNQHIFHQYAHTSFYRHHVMTNSQ